MEKTLRSKVCKPFIYLGLACLPFLYSGEAEAQKPIDCPSNRKDYLNINKINYKINYKINLFKKRIKFKFNDYKKTLNENKNKDNEQNIYTQKTMDGVKYSENKKYFYTRSLDNYLELDFPSDEEYEKIIKNLKRRKEFSKGEAGLFEKGILIYDKKQNQVNLDTSNVYVVSVKDTIFNKEFDNFLFRDKLKIKSDELNVHYWGVVYFEKEWLRKEKFLIMKLKPSVDEKRNFLN